MKSQEQIYFKNQIYKKQFYKFYPITFRPWLSDVRNRLLLSTEQQDSGKASFTPIPTTSDVPIFDDEEDTVI